MPYFKNDNVNILFIHIPKTGGTSVEVYLSLKFNIKLDNKSLYFFSNEETKLQFENKNLKIDSSLQHLSYNKIVECNEIFNIDFKNIEIITIVRNPYERIISELFWRKQIKSNSSKEEVYNEITKFLKTGCDCHQVPQYKFLEDKDKKIINNIHILKTETLNADMKKLGYNNFNVFTNINKNKINYYDLLNKESINLINNFYHYDFKLFNYKKL